MKILNLDEFITEDRIIRIEAVDYLIPTDIPLMITVRLMDYSDKINDPESDNMKAMTDGVLTLYDLFKIKQPDLEFEKFVNLLSMEKFTSVINFIYADKTVAESRDIIEKIKTDQKKNIADTTGSSNST